MTGRTAESVGDPKKGSANFTASTMPPHSAVEVPYGIPNVLQQSMRKHAIAGARIAMSPFPVMMTRDEFTEVSNALRHRGVEELAAFVASLLLETETGIGDYARAFAARDPVEAARLVGESIGRWRHWFKGDTYRQAAACAQRLEWTLDAIERFILPHHATAAFDLLVRFFEQDNEVGPDDLEHIGRAFRRAAELFAEAAQKCSPERVRAARECLLAQDSSGYREWLRAGTGIRGDCSVIN